MNKSRRHLTNKEREPYWLEIINAWQTSGKKTEQFCQENKIAVSSFYQWRNRLMPDYPLRTKKSITHPKPTAPQKSLFVPVQIKHDQYTAPLSKGNSADGVILHYPNGCFVNLSKGFDPQILSWINKAMGV